MGPAGDSAIDGLGAFCPTTETLGDDEEPKSEEAASVQTVCGLPSKGERESKSQDPYHKILSIEI